MTLRKVYGVALLVLSAAWVFVAVVASPGAAMGAGVFYLAVVTTANIIREQHDGRCRDEQRR